MSKNESMSYTFIPAPRLVQDYECASCGQDPSTIWHNNFPVGRDENLCKERIEHLCKDCAESSAVWWRHRLPGIHWAVKA